MGSSWTEVVSEMPGLTVQADLDPAAAKPYLPALLAGVRPPPRLTGLAVAGATVSVPLLSAAGVMLGIGLLAALGPARRGLAVQPTEALRAE